MTNSLSFLPDCDRIFMIDNGTICESGTYKELLKKKGVFSQFIGTNSNEFQKKENDEKKNGNNFTQIVSNNF